MVEQRPDLQLELVEHPGDPARQAAGRHEHADKHDRNREGRDRDDAQENFRPDAHAPSLDEETGVARACWYASRPRSIAVVTVSRPRPITSRPLAAASVARSRPSRAFSPRKSRVSCPDAGA